MYLSIGRKLVRIANQNNNQINCFVAALSELRKKNRCFVKYECNGCLHITVN